MSLFTIVSFNSLSFSIDDVVFFIDLFSILFPSKTNVIIVAQVSKNKKSLAEWSEKKQPYTL